jgi:hypothetical protein
MACPARGLQPGHVCGGDGDADAEFSSGLAGRWICSAVAGRPTDQVVRAVGQFDEARLAERGDDLFLLGVSACGTWAALSSGLLSSSAAVSSSAPQKKTWDFPCKQSTQSPLRASRLHGSQGTPQQPRHLAVRFPPQQRFFLCRPRRDHARTRRSSNPQRTASNLIISVRLVQIAFKPLSSRTFYRLDACDGLNRTSVPGSAYGAQAPAFLDSAASLARLRHAWKSKNPR